MFHLPKTHEQLANEWDALAPIRDNQIVSHQDRSYDLVLEPWILGRVGAARSVIDIGCGTGRLTAKLRQSVESVIGVDPSPVSIGIARSHDPLGDYEVASAEEWARLNSDMTYDLAVTNMVLMDTLDLEGLLLAVAKLVPGGRIIGTIAHPSFWPLYWGYANRSDFDYLEETSVQAPFKTSSKQYGLPATHIHRPVQQYIGAFRACGYNLMSFVELRGPEAADEFQFPRFIAFEAGAPE